MSDEPEQESTPTDIPPGSAADGVIGILLLCIAPRHALRLLFSGNWPKLLVTLLMSYSVVPLLLNQVIPATAGLGHLFISLNKQFPITPVDFTRACYFGSVFGLPTIIILLALIQALLLKLQRQSVPLIEGIAGLAYSAWPLFLVSLFRQLLLLFTTESSLAKFGLSLQNPISVVLIPFSGFLLMFIQVLILVAACWGVWIWMRFIQGMTDLPAERIIATCVIICALPGLFVLILVASYLITVEEQGHLLEQAVPDLEHIRRSLIFTTE